MSYALMDPRFVLPSCLIGNFIISILLIQDYRNGNATKNDILFQWYTVSGLVIIISCAVFLYIMRDRFTNERKFIIGVFMAIFYILCFSYVLYCKYASPEKFKNDKLYFISLVLTLIISTFMEAWFIWIMYNYHKKIEKK
jgi:hypothetical protein